jgi:hypothetical protein
MGFSSPGFSHSLPWPIFQLASSRLSAPLLPQTVGLFPLWLSFLPGALSVVAKHRIFSQALLLRVLTNKEFGFSLSRTADPPEVFGLFVPPSSEDNQEPVQPGSESLAITNASRALYIAYAVPTFKHTLAILITSCFY